MLIDANERFCLTYKTGEADLRCFMRRYNHGIIERADQTSREGCSGANIASKNCFLISDDNMCTVFDDDTFKVVHQIQVPLNVSSTREVVEIISVKVSEN